MIETVHISNVQSVTSFWKTKTDKMTRIEMDMTSNLLAINLLQVLMIFYKVWATLDKYVGSGPQILPAAELVPVIEPEQFFLKKYLLIGLSFIVALMVAITIVVITKMRKSNEPDVSSSSDDHSLLDLSYKERWDYIKQKEEEIKKLEQEKIAKIETKAAEILDENVN